MGEVICTRSCNVWRNNRKPRSTPRKTY